MDHNITYCDASMDQRIKIQASLNNNILSYDFPTTEQRSTWE